MKNNSTDALDFSVIIPVYNGERYLREALESIFNDSWKSVEVIVVDDGSTDGTADIVRSYPGVRYYYQQNQGVASARNQGIRHARGALIAFLDADDIWLSGRFAKTHAFFQKNPNEHYVVGYLEMFLEKGYSRPENIKPEWLEVPSKVPGTCCMAARKQVFERVGLFNTSYRSGEDLEWFQRAGEAGVGMAWLPVPLVRRRVHDQNLSTMASAGKKSRLLHMMREAVKRKKENE
ncbi:MAG: glycosyltransferase [Bacteroidales bacterium]